MGSCRCTLRGAAALLASACDGLLIDALGTDVAFASLCPDVKPMRTPLGETDGSCNRAGCHTSGFRMHVP